MKVTNAQVCLDFGAVREAVDGPMQGIAVRSDVSPQTCQQKVDMAKFGFWVG